MEDSKFKTAAQDFGDKLDGVADKKFDSGGYLRRVSRHANGDWVSTITMMLLAIIGYEVGFALFIWWWA